MTRIDFIIEYRFAIFHTMIRISCPMDKQGDRFKDKSSGELVAMVRIEGSAN